MIYPNIYEPGVGGIPTTTPAPLLPTPLSYEDTTVARGGSESCTLTYAVPFDEALEWLSNGLMRSIDVYSPDAAWMWGGVCTQVEVRFGQESRSRSLDGMANRVRCKYTTVLGTPGTSSSISDTESQAIYGIKDAVLSVGTTTATAAANASTRYLRQHKNPQSTPSTAVQTGDLGDAALILHFTGWYYLLDWLVTSITSQTTTVTTTQLMALIAAYNAVNAFFSTNAEAIEASGISETEFVEADTSYKQKIEKLFEQGTAAGERLAWMVGENRAFSVATWAGATPDTIDYQRYLQDGRVYDATGGVVEPWEVWPDTMYQVVDLLEPANVATAQDDTARFYVERVTRKVDESGWGVTLEPTEYTGVDAVLARLGGS